MRTVWCCTGYVLAGLAAAFASFCTVADVGAKVTIEDFSTGGMQKPTDIRSRMDARVTAKTLYLDIIEAQAAGAHVSAAGSLDLLNETVDARFSMEAGAVESLLSVFGLSTIKGAVAVKGTFQGHTAKPTFTLLSTARDVRINDIEVGTVLLEAELNAAGRLDVGKLSVDNRGSSLEASGDMQLFANAFEL